MLIYLMSVSVDGFIADREGGFGWSVLDEEQFAFHVVQTPEPGGFLCGRKLCETMLVWETDLSLRDDEAGAEFADVWCAIPKAVFSTTLVSPDGKRVAVVLANRGPLTAAKHAAFDRLGARAVCETGS